MDTTDLVSMEVVGIPIILGRKPLKLPPPVVFRAETEIAHCYERVLLSGDVEMSPTPIYSYVNSRTFKLYAGGRLFATTRRFVPVRDEKGKTVAVRLFKNQTVVH